LLRFIYFNKGLLIGLDCGPRNHSFNQVSD
jgi:hypothetical protein